MTRRFPIDVLVPTPPLAMTHRGLNYQPDAGCSFCSVLDDEMPDACEGCKHDTYGGEA